MLKSCLGTSISHESLMITTIRIYLNQISAIDDSRILEIIVQNHKVILLEKPANNKSSKELFVIVRLDEIL